MRVQHPCEALVRAEEALEVARAGLMHDTREGLGGAPIQPAAAAARAFVQAQASELAGYDM